MKDKSMRQPADSKNKSGVAAGQPATDL